MGRPLRAAAGGVRLARLPGERPRQRRDGPPGCWPTGRSAAACRSSRSPGHLTAECAVRGCRSVGYKPRHEPGTGFSCRGEKIRGRKRN